MAVRSEILYSGLTSDKRLDPEYYKPEYLVLSSTLDKLGSDRLGDLSFVTDGIHASPQIAEDGGIRYLSAKCVKDNTFSLSEALSITSDQNKANPRTQLREDDILLTTVGTIGNAAVVRPDLLPANADRHLGIIRLYPSSKMDPYYLSAFLNSWYGRAQTLREATGNVQLNLFIEKIKALRIPRLSNEAKVAEMVRRSYATLDHSVLLYEEAESLLVASLALNGLDLSPSLFYEHPYRDVAAACRADAEYYQPKYLRLMNALKATQPEKIIPLGECLSFLTNGHTPLHHDLSAGEIPFLTAEHVFDFRVNYDSDKRIERAHHEGELKRTQLQEGDFLITIKGRIGNAAVVEDLPVPTNINQDVALLRLKDGLPPYYLLAYLNSIAGKSFSEQYCTGQINPFLGLGNLRLLPIPIYDHQRMTDIADETARVIGEARKAREESRRLLEEAKSEVERAIAGHT